MTPRPAHIIARARTIWPHRQVAFVLVLAVCLGSGACAPVEAPTPQSADNVPPTVALLTAAPTLTFTPILPTATPLPNRLSPADLAATAAAQRNGPGDGDAGGLGEIARRAVAERRSVALDEVEIVAFEAADWTIEQMACRDIAPAVSAEASAAPTVAALTTATPRPTTVVRRRTATPAPTPMPGRRALILAGESVYEVRVGEDGRASLCVEQSLYDDHPDLFLARDPVAGELVAVARTRLGSELDLPEASISVASVRPVIWEDASLGCPEAGSEYAQIAVEGYRIALRLADREYIFHTDFERVLRCTAEE